MPRPPKRAKKKVEAIEAFGAWALRAADRYTGFMDKGQFFSKVFNSLFNQTTSSDAKWAAWCILSRNYINLPVDTNLDKIQNPELKQVIKNYLRAVLS